MSGPQIRLFDAVARDLDEAGLRRVAREVSGPFVSRSYRSPVAVVATWDLDVGVDVERVDPSLDLRFALSIATPQEVAELAELARRGGPSSSDVASLWSAKEAVAKAFGNPLARDPRRVDAPARWTAESATTVRQHLGGPWWARALDLPAGLVGWVVWRVVP